jgi:four helix bundle protein
MDSKGLKDRTKRFALNIIKLAGLLPQKPEGWVVGKQIIKAGTSVGANYRAVCRAKSERDFVAKLGAVIEEADESLFWLEIIEEGELVGPDHGLLFELKKEANELIAIFVASSKTIKKRIS